MKIFYGRNWCWSICTLRSILKLKFSQNFQFPPNIASPFKPQLSNSVLFFDEPERISCTTNVRYRKKYLSRTQSQKHRIFFQTWKWLRIKQWKIYSKVERENPCKHSAERWAKAKVVEVCLAARLYSHSHVIMIYYKCLHCKIISKRQHNLLKCVIHTRDLWGIQINMKKKMLVKSSSWHDLKGVWFYPTLQHHHSSKWMVIMFMKNYVCVCRSFSFSHFYDDSYVDHL